MKELSREEKIKVLKQAAIICWMNGNVAGDRICQDWSGEKHESPESIFNSDELDKIAYQYQLKNSNLEDYEEGYHGMHDEMVASFAIATILESIIEEMS